MTGKAIGMTGKALGMTDEDLREEFATLRAADARETPAFESVMSRRPTRTELSPRWPVLATAAAAAMLMLSVVVTRTRRADAGEAQLVVPQEVIALSSWTAPTDVLLEGARMHLVTLVTQAPSLGASMVDTLRGQAR